MSWDRYKSILDEVSARLKSSTTPSGRIDQSMAGRVASDMASIEEHRAPEEVQDTIDSELSGMSLRDRLGVISEKMGMASTVDSPFISEVAERVAPRVGSRRGVLPDPRGFNLVSDVVDPIRNREREQFDEARFSEVASALDRSFEGNDDDITRDYLSKLLSEQRSPIDGRISYSLNGVPISNSRDYADHILDRYYEYRNHDRLIDEDPEYRNRYIREISGGMSPEQYRGYLVNRYRRQLGEIESSYNAPMHEELLDVVDYDPRSGLPVDEQRLVDDLREKLWTLEHNDSWWRSLGGGVTEGFNWADLLSLGVAGIGTDINQIGSLKRFRDALNSNPDQSSQEVLQTLSPRDQRMVRLYQIENDVEESFNLYGGRSSASTAGSALGAMPEFLAQMGITGGLGNAAVAALGRRFSEEAAEQITYKVVRDAFKESFKSGFKKVGEKFLRTTGSAAVSAAVQTPISPMTLQNYADRTMAQYRWNGRMMEFSPESAWSRGWKSAIDTFAEYFSENVEGVISIGVEASGRGLSRLLHTDRLMYGADRQLRGFWHRHPSLRFLHDRFKISGPITETLSESIGDLVHPLLSGETERWDEMASSEYWWNLALSSTLMSATMNTPSLIALGIEANETRRMGNAREQAIGRIKSAELREMLWNALASDDISRSAETLSSFNWRNVSAEDKGNALDFIQSSLALEVMHSEENESRRLKLFDPIIKDAAQSVYRGSDASIPDFGGQLKLVYAQPQEGDIEQVVSGDYSSKDGVYYVRGKGGTPEARAVGSGLKVVEVPLDDFIAEQYALMFGSRIQQERMRDVMQFVQAAARSGAPATQLLLEKGYSVYRVGNKITLTDGVEGVVEDVHGGGNYIVRRSDGQVVSVGFLDVLQPNPEVANAQIDMANNPEQSPMDGITEPQTSGADGTVRVGNTIRFGEKIGVVTEIQSDGSLVVNVNDEYESIPVSSVTENLGDSPLIPQLDPVPPADSSQAAAEQTSSGSTQSADQAAIVSTPATKAQINIPVTKKGEIDYESIADPDILAQLYISKLGEEEAKEEVLALIAIATEDLQRTKKTLTQSRSANVRMQKRDKIKLIESRIAMLNVALERIAGQPAAESTQVSTADESQTQEKEDWRKEIPVPRAQRIEQLFPEINTGVKVYDWEIYALAMIASGQRFIWDGSKYGVRGLVEELFGRDREGKAATAERQSRISMIASPDKGGISIDSAAESIYSQLDGYTHEYDITDIRDAVINALLGVYSPSQAMALLEEIAARENDAEERYYEDKIGGPVLYSDEVDEYGNHFILASDGTSNFGVIDAESGLKHAPIKLSMGDNTVDENGNNHGYGLLHIEAERGDEIRKAGYSSVQDFVESVAKNYTDIREGGVIANNQTYLLELVDDHNNTLFIQLSKNGEYWTINSAGIFRKKYSRNKRKVYDRPALSPDTNTNTSGVDSGNANGVTAPAGNSPQTSVNKDTTTGPNLQEESAKFAQNGPVQSEERETYDNVLSASEAQSEESVLLDDSQAATQADNNTASLGINSSELSKSKGTTTDPNLQEESVDLVQFNIQPAGITHRSRHLLSAGNTESGSGQSKIGVTPSLLDVVRTLYSKGKEVASKLFGMKYFDVAQTPKFMQGLGLRGDKFTIKYGVIARHLGKDSSHTLTERDWGQLPQALQNPFAISKLIDKEDSYRIYTTLRTEDGEFVVVGADVKNAGREIEVNAISTVFGRRNNANLSKNEEVIYRSKEITPEQSALLERPNFAQYPIDQELSNSKGTTIIPNSQISKDGKVSGKEAPIDAELERVTIVDDLLDEYDARIDDAERKLESHRKELEEVKGRYGKEYNNAQTDLFGQSANDREAAKGGNLFNIEANLSQENMDSILVPIQAQIVALERRVQELKDEREAYHEYLLESEQAQPEIPFYINRTPSSSPEVISSERWNALVDQLKHILGEENVITDPEVMRFVYEASMGSASGMRHAMVESTNERFNQLLEELSEENADRTIFDLGNPSPAMLSVGIPNRPLRLNGNKLIKKAKQHKFAPQAIANLPQVIENPIAIFKGSYEGTYAILVELNINGSNVLATVDINKASELNVNLITSVYGKEKRLVAKWIDSGKALYIDKEKALNYLIPPALIAGDPSNTGLDDTAKIVQNFKNSIIEPQDLRQSIIGYHGSKADFSAFDHAFMSTGEGAQAYGYGTYITEVAEIADKYASAGIGTQISLLEESIAIKRDGIIAGERYISELKSKRRQFDINDPIRQVYGNAIRFQEGRITEAKEAISKYEGLIEDLRQTHRNRYTVHIPDDTGANYLPYDLPIGSDIADRINSKLEMVAPDATLISYLQSGRQAQRIIAEGLGVDERSEAVSDFLASVGLVGVSYPANFTRGGRKDGAKNYVIFNPEDAKIVDKMRLFKIPQGEVYGFTVGGKIYLDPTRMTVEAPIHEYVELWSTIVARENPGLWERGKRLITASKMWQQVNEDPNYRNASEDVRVSEALSRIVAAEAAGEAKKISSAKHIVSGIRSWLKKFWGYLKQTFSSWSSGDLDALSLEEFTKLPLRDFVEGVNISDYIRSDGAGARLMFIGEQGAQALDQAEEANQRLDNLDIAREMEADLEERERRLEKLRKAKPVKITGDEIEPNEDLEQYRKNARAYANQLRGEYTNADTGAVVEVNRSSIKETLHHDYKDIPHLVSVAAIPQIIENGIFITSERNSGNKNVERFDYYITGLRIGRVDYTVKFVVSIRKDGSRYYDHKLTQIEKGCLLDLSAISSTESANKAPISEVKDKRLLDIIQTNPKENARKIKMATGWERGADGKWRYETEDPKLNERTVDRMKNELSYQQQAVCMLTDLFERGSEIFSAYPDLQKLRVVVKKGESVIPEGQLEWDEEPYDRQIVLTEAVLISHFATDALEMYGKNDRNIIRAKQGVDPNTGEAFKSEAEQREAITRYTVAAEEWLEKYRKYSTNRLQAMARILAHEVQHAVQFMEGFARGANVQEFQDMRMEVLRSLNFHTDGSLLDGNAISDEQSLRDALNKEILPETTLKEAYAYNLQRVARKFGYENIDALVDDYTNLPSAFEQYRRTAGEVEARNVQKRHEMTPGDRRQTLAIETEDVARKDQIFLRSGIEGRYQSLDAEVFVKNQIEQLFNQAISGEFEGKPISIGRLTDAGKAYLEQISGVPFKDKVDFVLNPSDLVHIYKDHFGNNEKDKGQNIPLDIEDIRNLADVISSPDKVIFFKEGEGNNRNMFYFFKGAEDGTYNLMEIYSDRKGNLTAKTFYKTRKGSNQRVIDIEKSLLRTSEPSLVHPLSDAKVPQMFEFSNIANDFNSKLRENDGSFSDEESDIRYRSTKHNDYNVTPEAYAEMVEIREAAKRNGTFMLVPNGEPTNLSERQWLQVRTRAFKAWFGDWEKAARVEKLRKSSPISIEYSNQYDLTRKSAKAWMKEHIKGGYTNLDTGEQIFVTNVGINEVTSHGANSNEHLKSLSAIPKMIEGSVFIDELVNRKGHDKYDSYRYYVCGLKIDGVDYTAKMVVGVKGDRKYYDHRLTKIEKGDLINNLNGLSNSVAENQNPLVSGNKDTKLNEILQTNASKVVDANGEPMVVYHGTPNEFTIFDKTKQGTSTDRGIWGNGFYFTSDRTYAGIYESRHGKNGQTLSLFLNIKNPLFIDTADINNEGKKLFSALNNKYFTDDVFEDAANVDENMRIAQRQMTDELIGSGYDGVAITYGGATDEYVAFEPNQIKSATDNDGRFSDEDDDIRYRRGSGDIFYSNAEEAVWAIKQEKATPEQWLNMLQKSGGLKASEDKWIGLSDWLKSSEKKTLSKQEVLEYIAQNKIRIEETTYSSERAIETTPEFKALRDRYRTLVRAAEEESQKSFDDFVKQMEVKYGFPENEFDTTALSETEYNIFSSRHKDIMNSYIDAWKTLYDEYGDNFDKAFVTDIGGLRLNDSKAAMALLGLEGDNPINSTREGITTRGLDGLREIALTVPTIEPWGRYDEIHFGDAGDGRAIAWIRFGETVDEDGNRVLVIDEIQSKRHQDGRSRGYKTKGQIDAMNRAVEAVAHATRELNEYRDSLREKYNYEELIRGLGLGERTRAFMDAMSEEERTRYTELNINHTRASAHLNELRAQNGRDLDRMVPEAPFEKNWAELAMKRMLRYAAENGFDKIAWTTGEQQAERYDLSKQIDAIGYRTLTGKNGEQRYNISAYRDGNTILNNIYDSEAEIERYYGKDIARKIVNGEGEKSGSETTLSGLDLKVGGQGMQGFYDKMLVEFMNKYGKRWGVKVGDVTMPRLMENNTMHAVEVTDAMRDSVMEGQLMFRLPFIETGLTPRYYLEETYRALLQNANKDPNFAERINGILERIREYDAHDFVAETYKVDPLSDDHLTAVSDVVYDLQREYGISSQIRVVRDLKEFREAILREVLDGESYKPSKEELAELKKYIEERYTEIAEGIYSHLSDVIILRADVARDKRYAGQKLFHEWTHAIEKRMRKEDKEFADLFEHFRGTQDLSYTRKLLEPRYKITDDLEGRERGATELLARGVEKLYQWAKTDAYFGLEDAALDPVVSYMEQREVPADLVKLITTCLKQIKKSKYDTSRDDGSAPSMGGYGPRYYLERARRDRVPGKEVGISRDVLETVSPGGGVSETRRLGNERGGGLQASAGYSRDLTTLSYPSFIQTLKNLSARFGVPVEVVEDTSRLRGAKRTAKGWFDIATGKVVIVLPNSSSIEDVEATYLHEVVAHYGLRRLMGTKFRPFLQSVWDSLPTEKQQELLKIHRTDRSDIAVEEFIAELAEGNVTVGLMARIVAAVRKFFRDIMGLPLRMSEKDILYMLYLSKRNLESASSNLAKVQILSDQRRMKDQLDVRFRQKRLIYDGATGQFVETDTKDGWSISKDAVKAVWKGARKLLQDRMIHYKDFQDMLEGRGVKVDNLTDFYNAENRFTSRAEAARSRFEKDFIDPLSNVISLLSDQTGLSFDNISDYIAAETAEERDRSGVQAVSREEKDPWNYWYVNGLIRSTRERITNSRNDIFAKEGYSALSEDEKKIISKEILKKFENDGWDALADHERFVINEAAIDLLWMRIRAITDQTLEYFVQGGLKTREGIEKIKGHGWKYYTPLINFDTEVENMEDPLQVYDFIQKQTTRRAGVALHKAEGRKTKPANPVISMLNIAERVIVASEMNKTKQYLLRLLRSAEKKMGAEQADSLWRMAKVYFVKAKDESGKVHILKTTETPSAEELEKARKLKESIIETKINLREIHQDLKKLEKDLEKANGPRRRRIAERIADLEKEKEKLLNSMLTQEAEETITTTPGNFDFSDETPLADQIDRQRIVEIYENGTLIQIKFKDPAIANAINGQMSSQFAEYADKLLNKTFLGDITRWRAASVTTLSPDFLLRNGVRDFIHASLIHLIDAENGQFRHFMKDYKSKLAATKRGASGTGKPLTAAECGAFSVLTKEGRVALVEKYGKARVYDTLFEIFVIEGGQTGFVHVRETETLEKDMRRSVTSKRTSGSKVARSAKSTSRKIVEGYKHLNEAIEDATRFATFVANIEAGKSVFDAVTQAKNITVNFNRKGELTGALGTIYMFFNPTVQGTAQLANVAAKNPLRASVVALTLVSLGFLNYGLKKLLEYDEDDDNLYTENIPDYLYDNHAVLPLFGRNSILQILPKHLEEKMTLPFKSTWFVKIPLPNGSRFLYNWGAILARAAYGEYESWTKFTGDMVDAFLSETLYGYSEPRELGRALIPSFAQPFYDVAVNKDAFGRPIHRDDKFDTNIPDSELGMSNVTPVCYFTCKALHTLFGGTPQRSSGMRSDGTINSFLSAFDINPSNLEYIISEFAGGPGRTGLKIWRTALSLFDEDEDFDLRNIPVINTVVGQSRQTRPNSEYYDTRKGIEAMRTIYDRELSSGNISRDNPEYVLFTRRKAVFDQLKKRVNNILKKRNTFNIDTPEWKMYNEQMDYMMRVTNKVMGSVVFSDEDWINQTNSQFDRYFSAEIMNGIAKGNETK